ncbi:MAG: site-specific integrase [Bacteroidales bacterium]|nr:site-specific integrase [Bacteroidales bacterium]
MAKDEEGLDYYAFENYSLAFLNTKTAKRALKIGEIKAFFKYKADPKKSEYNSLNYFKFMYLCRGMNFIDLCHLKKEQIKKDEFKYVRMKTGTQFTIPIYNISQAIIDKYLFQTQDSPFVFPILKEKYDTPRKIKERIKKKRAQVNKDLKDIAKELKIDKEVKSYVSRHTFATILNYLGEPTAIISEQLGHANEKTTKGYLADFEEKKLKDSTDKAVNAVL